jgi:16S rRNA (guanine966-N2)-methyltransferase
LIIDEKIMRIIGGKAKGKTLHFPSGSKERPTSDFLRETLFNILGSLEDKKFLDLFAGSGSVGLEAVSRDAREVYFVEKNKELAGVIKKNIPAICAYENCSIITADIENALRSLFKKKHQFDIIFVDPPYNRGLAGTTLKLLDKYQVIDEEGVIVIQHSIKESIADIGIDHIEITDERKYGENVLTFFKWREKDAG